MLSLWSRSTRLLVIGTLALNAAACGAPAAVAPPSRVPDAPPPSSAAQPYEEGAPAGDDRARLREAIELMDAKRLAEAQSILEALHARHPHNAVVLHELALTYRLSKQPDKAVALLTPYVDQLSVESVAGLASALDEAGRGTEAIAVLRAGLKRYPRSGLLHSEIATTVGRSGDVQEAIHYYLLGIDAEPAFAASYYNLANLLTQSRYRGLALIYGESFRLLEPTSPRSHAMAESMVKVCQEAVRLEKKGGKTEANVSLAPDLVLKSPADAAHMPLANAFELTFGPGLVRAHLDGFSLASLHGARRMFLDTIRKPGGLHDWKSVPIFPWLLALDAAGHLEAYDYWLYAPANPDEAGRWMDGHREAMEAMAQYVAAHPLFPPQR